MSLAVNVLIWCIQFKFRLLLIKKKTGGMATLLLQQYPSTAVWMFLQSYFMMIVMTRVHMCTYYVHNLCANNIIPTLILLCRQRNNCRWRLKSDLVLVGRMKYKKGGVPRTSEKVSSSLKMLNIWKEPLWAQFSLLTIPVLPVIFMLLVAAAAPNSCNSSLRPWTSRSAGI